MHSLRLTCKGVQQPDSAACWQLACSSSKSAQLFQMSTRSMYYSVTRCLPRHVACAATLLHAASLAASLVANKAGCQCTPALCTPAEPVAVTAAQELIQSNCLLPHLSSCNNCSAWAWLQLSNSVQAAVSVRHKVELCVKHESS